MHVIYGVLRMTQAVFPCLRNKELLYLCNFPKLEALKKKSSDDTSRE